VTYRVLRDLGMKRIFGNPGSTELPFLRDMPPDFQYVLALHERTAIGMALGYAMGTGKAAFVNVHSVASVGNGLSALVDAFYCHAPLVVTTEQQDRRQVFAEPFLVSRAVEAVKPYVTWAYEPLRAEDVSATIARGYYLAMQPPMGPVFISIPMDDWTHECQSLSVRQLSQLVEPDSAALEQVVRTLNSSKNTALVVGAQIEDDHGWNEVVALAEHLNADVYAGRACVSLLRLCSRRHRQARHKTFPDYELTGTRCRSIGRNEHRGQSSRCGEIPACHAVPHEQKDLAPRTNPPRPNPEYPITAAYLFSVLNRVMPRNAVIAEECPSSKGDLDKHLLLDEPGSFYSVPNGILGFGLPAAVGLQLAHAHRRVVCPVGDGSIQYSIQALWSAVQYKAPVIFIALRNGDYTALKSFCDFTQVGRNVPGMDLPGIDMVKIAQGYGMAAQEVDRPEELEPALKEAFASQEPCLISVKIAKGGQTCMGMDQSVHPPNYG
jgi:benzoylformate decarboxylase